MLIAGLGVFLAGSLVGAPAGDMNWITAARALTGVGAAMVIPLALPSGPRSSDTHRARADEPGTPHPCHHPCRHP
ncbi:hypothetical protein GCM10023084_23230 [Streptomyces lacrimifluminis]|uniref:Uncharacterized protein n=1 Tax=Streptomyces lacrimifluminis TaxID=1500077 RepID=A0A917P1P2_9ACTN|nr:hypothetical protein GCM10012282_57260 [Streptomyces lacrimifluminis]